VLFGFVISLVVAACAAFDGDPPDRSCRTDNDCFRAQGEACDQDRHRCVCMNPAFGCVQEDAGVAPSVVDDPSLAEEMTP
jgi:hypothetical protein